MTGFPLEPERVQVRSRSAIWAGLEAVQDEVRGIHARTEANRQLWRDRMATLVHRAEEHVAPLATHTSRMGVSDKDMVERVRRHRRVLDVQDTSAGVPNATVESLFIEFVDVASAEFVPLNLTCTVLRVFVAKNGGSYGTYLHVDENEQWRVGASCSLHTMTNAKYTAPEAEIKEMPLFTAPEFARIVEDALNAQGTNG
jgi:hypothetical protein